MTSQERAVGPAAAARRLGVSTRTVQRWLREGRLPVVRVGARLKVDAAAFVSPVRAAPSASRPIGTVLVANRGEIVVRIARTCRRLGIRSLAVVAPDQRDSWWADQADGRVSVEEGYLDGTAIIRAAREAGAHAVHPGYGFLAENAGFAEAVGAAELAWLGPPPEAIRLMGDKAAARALAMHEAVPVLPGSTGRRQSDRGLVDEADRIGLPVLVKPLAGGGGKGMHVVRDRADLRDALGRARREALVAFGDDRVLLERYLDRPRHVEIQVLFDTHGAGMHLGERECSLQRRHQKIVEESPSPALGSRTGRDLRRTMGEAALRLAAAAGYVGVGTVEFLLDEERGEFFFLEMNTRLQVEHPVTELVTGRDLVADQLAIASGAHLADLMRMNGPAAGMAGPGEERWGHAIEARLYAEDAEQGFLPSGGRIVALRWPSGPGIRVDAGVGEGDEIGTRYDPLLAKIVVGGHDRHDAIERLRGALADTLVLGPVTNLRLLRWIAAERWFARGETFTDTIPTRWHAALPAEPPDEAWRSAALALAETVGDDLAGWRLGGLPRLRLRSGEAERSVEIQHSVEVGERGEDSLVRALEPDRDRPLVHVDVAGRSVAFELAAPPTVESAVRHAAAGSGSGAVTAPMPGRVIAVTVREGDPVELHQPLVVLEAMKMENAVGATVAGTVAAVLARPGAQVQKGDRLIEIAALPRPPEQPAREPAERPAGAGTMAR